MENVLGFFQSHGFIFTLGLFLGYFIFLTTAKKDSSDDSKCDETDVGDNLGETKMVLIVRNDLKMGKGKAAAQCSHGAVMAYERAAKSHPQILKKWKRQGQRKVVLKIETEDEYHSLAAKAKEAGLIYAAVRDAGLTQIPTGSMTVLAVGPGNADTIDQLTGHLKLY